MVVMECVEAKINYSSVPGLFSLQNVFSVVDHITDLVVRFYFCRIPPFHPYFKIFPTSNYINCLKKKNGTLKKKIMIFQVDLF